MVKINGKEAADVCGMTVSQYLSANNYNPKHIVVELNEEILPKTEYDSTAKIGRASCRERVSSPV